MHYHAEYDSCWPHGSDVYVYGDRNRPLSRCRAMLRSSCSLRLSSTFVSEPLSCVVDRSSLIHSNTHWSVVTRWSLALGTDQRAENRGRRAKNRGRRAENRGRRAENGRRAKNRGRRAENRGRTSEGQKNEDVGPKIEAKGRQWG